MSEITAIKPQLKRAGRYNVFVDQKYRLSLSELSLTSLGLRVGQKVDDQELDQIIRSSQRAKAMDKAQYYLSFRPRSRAEVVEYLQRKEFDTLIIDDVVARLETNGLIDDYAFATVWVQSRNKIKHRSTRVLVQELRQKKVDQAVIDIALRGQLDDDELDNLRAIVKKKIRLYAYQDQTKFIRYLMAKGFGYSQIKDVLEELGGDNLQCNSDNHDP